MTIENQAPQPAPAARLVERLLNEAEEPCGYPQCGYPCDRLPDCNETTGAQA